MDPGQAVESMSSDEGVDSESRKRKRRNTEISDTEAGDNRERHLCPQCNRSFGRIEHMKRHAASHSNDRPFKCSVCEKGFYRLDTMQRHELIHREDTENAKPKGARACTECAVAKVRCSGGAPCTRCTTKDAECRYPEGRGKMDEPASPDGSAIDMKEPERRASSHHLLPPRLPMDRLNSVTAAVPPFSPSSWDHNHATSPNQWFPSNASIDFSVRSEFQEPPAPHRHTSFSASQVPPPAIASYSDSYSNLKQSGFVTQPSNNNVTTPSSVNNTGTRHWLETLLVEPQAIDARDVGTPGTAVSQRTSSMSETYLDGDGARLPKIGIHRRFNSRPSLPFPSPGMIPLRQTSAPRYGFPVRFCHPDLDNTLRDRRILDDYAYNEIRRNFERICAPHSSFLPPFDPREFPSYDHLQMFIFMYLDEFQPLCPMLHVPTLDLCSSHWLLPVALAALGCQFSDHPEAELCAIALTEFLRRAIMDLQETGEHTIDPVSLAQIKVLCCVGMTYSADERLEVHGWRRHLDTVGFCQTAWLVESNEDFTAETLPGDSLDQQWRRWRDVEARRRTGYGIWMLDTMWRYEFDERNLISLEDCKPPLPCQEVLWEAETAMQWQHVRGFSVAMPSLREATHAIYIEKRVEPTMGEFSRILLIHALYSRSWDVQTHIRNPMSHWLPTAAKQDLTSIPAFREPVWLPGEPSYFRWRNATCDCLDILHWRANSVTGAASGVEHPTLLHIHLARIILLTPFRAICNLVYGLTRHHLSSTAPSTERSIAENRAIVRRWAEHDQCKARLAMYHAGVLFWHVRLYSAKGFYEPPAVMLAALALWAWGTFTPKHPAVTSPNGTIPDHLAFGAEDETSYPTSINIDRPADDEIVQMYIRRGDRMQAMIAGVGDIRSAGGPVRVLVEGAKLTATLSNWGVSRRVMRVLTTLANVCQTQGVM